MEITDGLKDHIHDKVQHDLSDFPRVENVHVILDIEKYRQIAEVVVQAANHIRSEARAESDDMYVSIDSAMEKVAKQLRRSRDKVQNHKSREKLANLELEVQASNEPV